MIVLPFPFFIGIASLPLLMLLFLVLLALLHTPQHSRSPSNPAYKCSLSQSKHISKAPNLFTLSLFVFFLLLLLFLLLLVPLTVLIALAAAACLLLSPLSPLFPCIALPHIRTRYA